ncbi:MAG: glycosyltransferase family 39 protein [Candidatus Wildermuthbacteria bacterium]|nr:glycosyltransferase family 39 protein [Candidatus Wildermuthbacteria bacterium]
MNNQQRPSFEQDAMPIGEILLLLILFVAGLSFFLFSQQGLRLDEAQSLWQAYHSPLKILQIVSEDVHVPLYHLILHYWQILMGEGLEQARMLSLIFFALGIPALFLLGRSAYNSSVGLYAAILFAVSPFMNWFGNEIRMYTLLTLLAILSHYFFLKILRNQTGWLVWTGYFFVSLFGIFTHYLYFLLLCSQWAFAFFQRKQISFAAIRNFFIVSLLLGIVFSPWIFYIVMNESSPNAVPHLASPTSIDLLNAFSQFLFGFQTTHFNTIILSLWPMTTLFGFLAIQKNRKISLEATYFLVTLFVPVLLLFLVSITLQPAFLSRYLIFTVPSLYLLISWLFFVYPSKIATFLQITLIALMIGSLLFEVTNARNPEREDYKTVSAYLLQNAAPQDIIILSAPFTIYPILYYYDGPTQIATLPIWDRYQRGPIPPFDESALPDQVRQLGDHHQKAWLLLSYDQGYKEKIKMYFDTRFERLETRQFSPGLTLSVYRLRYDTPDLNL